MASITAPSRPKRNQPIRNAITAPTPIAPQFTDTMFHHRYFKIFFTWDRSAVSYRKTVRVPCKPFLINYKNQLKVQGSLFGHDPDNLWSFHFFIATKIHRIDTRMGVFHLSPLIIRTRSRSRSFSMRDAQSGHAGLTGSPGFFLKHSGIQNMHTPDTKKSV